MMDRFQFCSLSKYHTQPCFFEWDWRFESCPVEPRCMRRDQRIPEFERAPWLEPSHVRSAYVPIYVPAGQLAQVIKMKEEDPC